MPQLATKLPELPLIDPKLLDGFSDFSGEDPLVRRLTELQYVISKYGQQTVEPLLPLLLSLKGRPFTLRRGKTKEEIKHHPGYAPFEIFYRTRMARRTTYKTGRQVGKTSNAGARGLIRANCTPFQTLLYVTPQYEQVRRLSANVIGPFIEQSPVRKLFIGNKLTGSILQRTFANESKMLFSYAGVSADRIRGVSASSCAVDECQDLATDVLPVILECLSAAPDGGTQEFTGTPKSLENLIEGLWQDSSQAEWVIPCDHCRYWNIPALAYDLEKMVGPVRDDISYDKPGTICAKCGKPIRPHVGRWIHSKLRNKNGEELRWRHCGLHVPQQIMPMHYASREKWQELINKMNGSGNTPKNVFFNEVCGESYDVGSKLVTLTDLKKAACLPWPRSLDQAKEQCGLENYTHRVLAVDWGGGGQDMISFTTMAVMGMRADGMIDVIFGFRSLTPHEYEREAKLTLGLAREFNCQIIAHDYTGAGAHQEVFIIQAGWPIERVVPVAYTRFGATSKLMQFKPATKGHPRSHYAVDKTRSLVLTCSQIKTGQLRFFQDDYVHQDDQGLLRDFLALTDEKVDTRFGNSTFTIRSDFSRPDDFAQAVNIGCCTLWTISDKWPNLAAVAKYEVDPMTLRQIQPPDNEVLSGLI